MANLSANKYHVDLNNTRYNGVAAEQYYGPSRVRLLWYNNTKIYNSGYYELIMPDVIEVESPGGNDAVIAIKESITSRKTDVGNVITNDIPYTMEPADLNIPPNATTNPITGTFKITQTPTNLLLTGTYKQAAAVLTGYSYSNLRITNVYYEYSDDVLGAIPASGGSAILYVEYAVDKKEIWDSGADVAAKTEYGSTYNITSVTGDVYSSYDHVSFSSTGQVSAESLENNYYPDNINIAYVSKVTIQASFTCPISGKVTTLNATWTSSGTSYNVICQLQYNIIETSTWNTAVLYLNNTSGNVDCDFDAKGGTDTVEIDSYRTGHHIYTSTYEEDAEEAVTAYISSSATSIASSSSSSVSGKNKNISVVASINKHNTSAVYATLTISNSGSTRYIYITVSGDYEYNTYGNWTYDSVGTEEISAAGGSTDVIVYFYRLKYSYWYSDDAYIGYSSTTTYEYATGVTTSVSTNIGTASGGSISVDSRGTTTGSSRVIYTINNVICNSGTFATGGHQVWQEANEYITSWVDSYSVYVSARSTSISGTGGSTKLDVVATENVMYEYTSGTYEFAEGTTATLSTNRTWATVSPTSVSNGGTSTLTLDENSSSSERTVTVTAKIGSYASDTCTVRQGVITYNWSIPVLTGSISVGMVPASGGSVTVYVPIYQVKTSNVGDVVEEYDETVAAIGLGGSASNGGSASGGSVSASSLGQTTTSSARLIYTIESVTVRGGDGLSYDISLSSSVYVYQAKNAYHFTTTRRDVSLSTSHTSISYSGETSSGGYPLLTFGGMQYGYYWYDSDPDRHYEPSGSGTMTLFVSTSSGTISPSGVQYGTGKTATLYADVNESLEEKTIVVTLNAYDHWSSETEGNPVTRTVEITQAAYVQPTREKARLEVTKCNYTSSARTTVEYEFYFDATDTDSYSGGTFSNVYALLMDALNGSGNQWDSDSIGTVTVAEGGTSATYSGTLSVGSATNRYLIIRDSNGILFQSGIEDPEV